MVKKITFLAKIIVIFFCTTIILNAVDLKIIPLKKPDLSKEIKKEKISKSDIKPKQKPVNKSEQKKIIKTPKKDPLLPKSKPAIVKKKRDKVDGIIIPKSKPLVAKKEIDKIKEKSKYFRQRDFELAKLAIRHMEKSRWTKA